MYLKLRIKAGIIYTHQCQVKQKERAYDFFLVESIFFHLIQANDLIHYFFSINSFMYSLIEH
uniref:Uncharacterized protein n=1 Tax=Arundo donax TaxID=35708 RepID=A0A0A9D4C9_ARUDO